MGGENSHVGVGLLVGKGWWWSHVGSGVVRTLVSWSYFLDEPVPDLSPLRRLYKRVVFHKLNFRFRVPSTRHFPCQGDSSDNWIPSAPPRGPRYGAHTLVTVVCP